MAQQRKHKKVVQPKGTLQPKPIATQQQVSGRFERLSRKKQLSLVYGGALLLLLFWVVLAQLLYPAGRMLPGVRIADKPVGLQTIQQVRSDLAKDITGGTVSLQLSDKSRTVPLRYAGISLAGQDTARKAGSYPLRQRIIPFSSVWIMLHRNVPFVVRYDAAQVQTFATEISKEFTLPSRNATVVSENGQIVLVSAQPSRDFSATTVEQAIMTTPAVPKMTVTVQPRAVKAARTDEQVTAILKEAQDTAKRPLVIKVGTEQIAVPSTDIAKWLEFPENGSGGISMQVSVAKLQAYVETFSPRLYKAPTDTRVTMVDGVETARVPGAPGRGLNVEHAAAEINKALVAKSDKPIELSLETLAPRVVYDRQYSGSNAGLANFIEQIASRRGYSIFIQELEGPQRFVSVGGDETMPTASIYKMLVAYAILKQIEAGQIDWSQPVLGGQNVSDCFEDMIVHSDNACGTAMGDLIGRQANQDMLHAIGMTSTFFDGERRTTANDLGLFLRKLQQGSILSEGSRDKLLSAMRRQIYRGGIPYGVGVPTADKVGALYSYLHDAAIIYGPNGPYIMVIMTKGSSWASISQTAREIHRFLNP